jgi:hypothetical protein
MIAVNELRIGNWIKVSRSNVEVRIPDMAVQVAGINVISGICINSNPHLEIPTVFPIHCAPINITEEILIKAGFEKRSHTWKDASVTKQMFINRPFALEYVGNWFLCKISYENLPVLMHGDVLHVHQLQNLWYSLTGQELNIQL